jgi:FkbM family methyltransferase
MAVYTVNDIVSNSICSQGSWETSDVSDIGTPGVALDIGGNVGYYSYLLANAGWHVETFEPLPMNLQLMKATACRNPKLADKIKVHPVGLGARDDSCVFVSGYDNVGDGWVRCGDEASKIRAGQVPVPAGYELRGSFPVQRLDDVMAKEGITKVDFVKIDVEGFECQVFKGGDAVLNKVRPKYVQSEVWPKMDHCLPADYLNMFTKANYKVAKTRHCEVPDSSLSGAIQDFFMCRKGSLLLQLH